MQVSISAISAVWVVRGAILCIYADFSDVPTNQQYGTRLIQLRPFSLYQKILRLRNYSRVVVIFFNSLYFYWSAGSIWLANNNDADLHISYYISFSPRAIFLPCSQALGTWKTTKLFAYWWKTFRIPKPSIRIFGTVYVVKKLLCV